MKQYAIGDYSYKVVSETMEDKTVKSSTLVADKNI